MRVLKILINVITIINNQYWCRVDLWYIMYSRAKKLEDGQWMVHDSALPSHFDSYADARRQGFLDVKGLKDEGKRVVGVFCTYSPVEVILAAGAVSVGICAYAMRPLRRPKRFCLETFAHSSRLAMVTPLRKSAHIHTSQI